MLFSIASMADSLSSSDAGASVAPVGDDSLDCRACEPGKLPTQTNRVETECCDTGAIDTGAIDTARFGIASEALQQTGLRDLACIRVSVSDREMTLDGEVGSYYLKQLATEAVRPHASGLAIKNRLQVPPREQIR